MAGGNTSMFMTLIWVGLCKSPEDIDSDQVHEITFGLTLSSNTQDDPWDWLHKSNNFWSFLDNKLFVEDVELSLGSLHADNQVQRKIKCTDLSSCPMVSLCAGAKLLSLSVDTCGFDQDSH